MFRIIFSCANQIAHIRPRAAENLVIKILLPVDIGDAGLQFLYPGAFDTLNHAMETYLGNSDKDNVSDDAALAVMRNTIARFWTLLGIKPPPLM